VAPTVAGRASMVTAAGSSTDPLNTTGPPLCCEEHHDDAALHECASGLTRGVDAAGLRTSRGPHRDAEDEQVQVGCQNMARPARIELAAPRLGGGCSIR
jgi:hypothetical protein